jgi:uncharacterized membrane protein
MNLLKVKAILIVSIAVLALLVASPALQRLLVFPQTDSFTELWLLSSQQSAQNYPFNITQNKNYNVTLGVGNNLGNFAYYLVEVKFRNETQPAADSFKFTPSSLPSLYNITVFVANKGIWEQPLNFSFNYTYDNNLSLVNFNDLILNGVTLNLKGNSASWDSEKNEFVGNLFFELWIYNSTIGSFQYNDRFVSLFLNMTV